MRAPLIAIALILALAACSGRDALPTDPQATLQTHVASAAAMAHGVVHDFGTDRPLASVPILIAPWRKGAASHEVARTRDDGTFSFAIKPGTYLMQIGDKGQGLDERAILHQQIIVHTGSQQITGLKPSPEPDVTYDAAQISGHLRLMTLNANQRACLEAFNHGREQLHLPRLQADEYLEEDAVAVNQEQSKQGRPEAKPLFGYRQVFGSVSYMTIDDDAYTDLPHWLAWDGHGMALVSLGLQPGATEQVIQNATNPDMKWYGAQFEGDSKRTQLSMGAEEWMTDPRS